jgi:hypothetical protein
VVIGVFQLMYCKEWIGVLFDVLFDLLKCFHHFAPRLYDSTIPYTSCLKNCSLIKFNQLKENKKS